MIDDPNTGRNGRFIAGCLIALALVVGLFMWNSNSPSDIEPAAGTAQTETGPAATDTDTTAQ